MIKTLVALSGGVDSSVAALLLKRAGFEVEGVFMKFWTDPKTKMNQCCSLESERRARQVALKLGIPFHVFDFKKEFKKRVVDYFLEQTRLGLTPNPCVVCNEEIKFGLFLDKALKMGAGFVATGHYVRLGRKIPISPPAPRLRRAGEIRNKSKILNSKFKTTRLFMATDKTKDQSYFLWRLNQKQLSRTLFPLGEYTKTEVRKIAQKVGLPTSQTKDSQNLCFLARGADNFLKTYLKNRPGKIIDSDGKIIGKHYGLGFFTLGQRQGIGEFLFPKYQSQGPYYVLAKNNKKNQLVVTRNQKDLLSKNFVVTDLNWLLGKEPKFPFRAQVKVRSRQNSVSAVIRRGKKRGQVLVKFKRAQRSITPGQSAVFYKGQELLGGGIIL